MVIHLEGRLTVFDRGKAGERCRNDSGLNARNVSAWAGASLASAGPGIPRHKIQGLKARDPFRDSPSDWWRSFRASESFAIPTWGFATLHPRLSHAGLTARTEAARSLTEISFDREQRKSRQNSPSRNQSKRPRNLNAKAQRREDAKLGRINWVSLAVTNWRTANPGRNFFAPLRLGVFASKIPFQIESLRLRVLAHGQGHRAERCRSGFADRACRGGQSWQPASIRLRCIINLSLLVTCCHVLSSLGNYFLFSGRAAGIPGAAQRSEVCRLLSAFIAFWGTFLFFEISGGKMCRVGRGYKLLFDECPPFPSDDR